MWQKTRSSWVAAAALSVLLLGCNGGGEPTVVNEVRTLSNRADLISGGDALVEVVLTPGTAANAVQVELNKRDITQQFAMRADGRFLGLVNGLEIGKNKLIAKAKGTEVKLEITNHPKGGPIFAGDQVQPWVCMTIENGLGPAMDAQCNAPTKVEYFYRSTNAATPGFLPYDPASPPPDVRMTTTDQGLTVPFIVRRERGTLDRYVYDIAVLADPAQSVSPWQPPRGWNRKLYYMYAGGALPQHIQGQLTFPASFGTTPFVFQELPLSRGFATAFSSGNVFGNSTNSVTSAEVTMMVKERVVETLGDIRYTLAEGGSGGSMQQHLIANAYPGLLDGIQPRASYQDIYTTNNEAQDCSLLLRYFGANGQLWPDLVQQNAVTENANELPGVCRSWTTLPLVYDQDWMNPTLASCFVPEGPPGIRTGLAGPGSPQPWMYDPVTNTTGVRCTLQDYQVALFGRRPDGFANRPYDNVGVQYGLKALMAGKITAEQFVHMNENVGGRDIDWNWSSQRSVADQMGLEVVYRSGQVNLGSGLATVPMIDNRSCWNFEIHSCFHSWVVRERLIKTNGHADNHVILTTAPTDPTAARAAATESFELMDRWVAAIKADTSNDLQAVKVVRNRPSDARDACWINGARTTDTSACSAAHPYYGDSRTGAGQALTVDVMKCQLKPLERSSYPMSFTDAQWARLQTALHSGVCDWKEKSVSFQLPVPWLSYASGPGGQPLGPAPTSSR